MLSESELLADQTQTLEQALDRLQSTETDVVEPTQVNDVDLSGALNITVECFKATVDLYHTISNEGVSKADIDALRAIQSRMVPFARLPTKVALESYEGLFTPTRSVINQTISQEAVLEQIGKTLKEWFFIFIDFIIRVVDWSKRVWNSEDFIRLRLKGMDSYLQSMNNQLMELVKYDQSLGRDCVPDLLALANTVLEDPKLTRSKAMLIAFNVGDHAKGVANTDRLIDRYFDTIMKDLVSFKQHIESNKPMHVSGWPGVEINDMATLLESLTAAMDDPELFLSTVRRDFWLSSNLKRLVTRPIFPAAHNIEQVQRLAKELRSVKRNSNFDDLKEVDTVVTAIDNLTNCVKGLERVIKFKQLLYADYYKASATYANFYIRAREHVESQLKANVGEDLNRLLMKRLSDNWEALLKKMGI